MPGYEFSLTVNREEVKSATAEAIKTALEAVAMQAEGDVILLVPVDTGNLKSSITHEVDDDEGAVVIGTDVKYAPYVEFGTGVFADNGEGRQTPWVYHDDKGFHYTRGQKPSHFLKNAISGNVDTYSAILTEYLSQLGQA